MAGGSGLGGGVDHGLGWGGGQGQHMAGRTGLTRVQEQVLVWGWGCGEGGQQAVGGAMGVGVPQRPAPSPGLPAMVNIVLSEDTKPML